ncbi:leucine-rich repeat domain-containing protein [Bacteroides sp. OttesenSCG-928-E20]|nr:leucine-rich repeat domain-containing protein [Bacteroides sp. OttesenSCG-928-E20]
MFKAKQYTLIFATALLMLGACSDKEDEATPNFGKNQVPAPHFTADMAGANDTRALVEDNDKYATDGELFRWNEGDQVLVRFIPENGVMYSHSYKVATVNAEHPNRCTFVPSDESATLPAGTYTVTGFSSYGAWTGMSSGAFIPPPPQNGNKKSDHLHYSQLMMSEPITEVTITDAPGNFNLSFKHLASVMRFVVIDDIDLEEGITVESITLSSDKELFDTGFTYRNDILESTGTTNSLTLNVTNGTFDAKDNSFHGFIAMSANKEGINPEKLQVAITLSNGSIFTATVQNTGGIIGLTNGFVNGQSYSFTMKLSNLEETTTVLKTTATGQISNGTYSIDDYLSSLGTLVVEGPINNNDLTAIANWMKNAVEPVTRGTKPVIKKLDLSGAKELETINNSTFKDCTSLEIIVLPEGVTDIYFDAFNGCTSLSAVTLPQSLETIDSTAFQGCTKLTSITLPQSVKSIGNSAFSGCTNLETVNLPESMPDGTLGTYAFWGTALRNIVIPSGIKTIPESCFQSCKQLNSVTLPEGLEEIQYAAFGSCSQLSAITIPASVKLVGYYAFSTIGMYMSIQFLGTLPVKDGGSANTTTAVPGYLVLNNMMCSMRHSLLLPKVIKASLAATYNTGINATVYYNYTGTDTDSPTDLTKYTKYIPKENTGDDFEGGNDWAFE